MASLFKILNFVSTKLSGAPSIDDGCNERLVNLLEKSNISNWHYSYYGVDRSMSNPRLYDRVYVGVGTRKGDGVGFVVVVDENIASAFGYIVNDGKATYHKRFFREYRYDQNRLGGFFSYMVDRCGGMIAELN